MSIKYWKGGNGGVEGSWTETLTDKTLDNEAAVDQGDGIVRIPSTAHTFIKGDYVVLNKTDSYDGNHLVVNVPGADDFDIVATFVAETFAVTDTAKSSNWQDENGIPVAVPAAADSVIFDNSAGLATAISPKHTEDTHWNCCENIARGDTGELELAEIIVDKNFTGRIGVDAENTISPLHISIADNGQIVYRSDSVAYIECSADDAVTSINIPLLVFDTAAGYLQISSDMNDGTWKSEWDTVKCLNRGTLELAANTVCQTIYTYASSVKLIIGAGCVDTSDASDPIDLYPGLSNVYSYVTLLSTIETDGLINFGTAALTLTKGR